MGTIIPIVMYVHLYGHPLGNKHFNHLIRLVLVFILIRRELGVRVFLYSSFKSMSI